MNEKSPPIQPSDSTVQSIQFNPLSQIEDQSKNDQPAAQKIPVIFPAISKEELIKTVNTLISKVNSLKDQIKEMSDGKNNTKTKQK